MKNRGTTPIRAVAALNVVVLSLAMIIALYIWGSDLWSWLRAGGDSTETNGATLRNIGLMAAGIIALPLALWRSFVANRQANISQGQLDTTQQTLRQERYQRGAEMLGNNLLSTRLGGIYALKRLAEDYPEEYHLQVMELLCAFVRNPKDPVRPKDVDVVGWEDIYIGSLISSQTDPFGEDVRAIIEFIGHRGPNARELEKKMGFRPDLRSANLTFGNLTQLDLSDIDFSGALFLHATCTTTNFSGTIFRDANFNQARLFDTNMRGAFFDNAKMDQLTISVADFSHARIEETTWLNAGLSWTNFSNAEFLDVVFTGANFHEVNLSGTSFMTHLNSYVTLTQAQLEQAYANTDDPPVLPPEAVDPDTHERIVWHERLREQK